MCDCLPLSKPSLAHTDVFQGRGEVIRGDGQQPPGMVVVVRLECNLHRIHHRSTLRFAYPGFDFGCVEAVVARAVDAIDDHM